MSQEDARKAAVENAISRIEPGMTIGLGSGRAVFALAELIGQRSIADIKAVVASPATAERANEANIKVIDLDADTMVDIAFDGADEVDPDFAMIKGGGAALLTEKLLLSAAKHVVIMCEDVKMVTRLGDTRLLPIEVVRFGWAQTRLRVMEITESATLRVEGGIPVVTSQNHYLLDAPVPDRPIAQLGDQLKLTLGVIDHGLFIDQADEVIVGHDDGNISVLARP